jgi:hypothetical protein
MEKIFWDLNQARITFIIMHNCSPITKIKNPNPFWARSVHEELRMEQTTRGIG